MVRSEGWGDELSEIAEWSHAGHCVPYDVIVDCCWLTPLTVLRVVSLSCNAVAESESERWLLGESVAGE